MGLGHGHLSFHRQSSWYSVEVKQKQIPSHSENIARNRKVAHMYSKSAEHMWHADNNHSWRWGCWSFFLLLSTCSKCLPLDACKSQLSK